MTFRGPLLGGLVLSVVFGTAGCMGNVRGANANEDAAMAQDARVADATADGHVPSDGAVTTSDGGQDATVPMDSAVPTDATVPTDAAVVDDSAVPMDGAMPADSAVPMDSSVSMDAMAPMDSGVDMDAGMPMDSGVMGMDAGPMVCEHDKFPPTSLAELAAGANTGPIVFDGLCPTTQPNEPCYQACQLGTFWWSYKATVDQTLNFTFTHRVEAALYTGTKLVNMSRVAGTAWNGSSNFEVDLTAGTRYWLQVRPFDADAQSLTVSRDRGDNDMFSHASPITEPLAGEETGHIVFDGSHATVQPNEPCYQNCVGSLWWKYEATGTQTVNVTTSSSMEVAVYTGTALSNLVRVGGSGWNGSTSFDIDLDPGTYWVQTRSFVSGVQWLNVKRAREDNDAFAHATDVPEVSAGDNSGPIDFNATTATKQPAEPCFQVCTGSLWWSYAPTADQTLNFTISSSMEIAVYTGASLGALVRVGGTAWNGATQFVMNVTAGTTYFIQVRPFANTTESFTIARARADHDLFANAAVIMEPASGSDTGAIMYNNVAATNEPNEPCYQNCAPSLWWSFTPSANYTATVTTSAAGEVIVYTGTTLTNLQQVGGTGWNGGDHFSWAVTAGTEYLLQVRPYTTANQSMALSRP